MAHINEETVKYLSRLSRIECSEEEVQNLLGHLKRVLDYVELLQEVDTGHLMPYSHTNMQEIGTLREDVVQPHLPREVFLANAPDQVGGMIRVPPVLKPAP